MASQVAKRVLVVAGLGNGSGTGAATARLFAKNGYSIALLARENDVVNELAQEINSSGGEAVPFSLPSYSYQDIASIWSAIPMLFPKPAYAIRAAVFNVGNPAFKNFLNITPEDVQNMLNVVAAAFAFSRSAIQAFQENDVEEMNGTKGTLIFTGATASLRGGVITSAFSTGKHGLRALNQSLAKEFGKESIHVAHSIIDGVILADNKGQPKADEGVGIHPDSIASAYLYLVQQDRSAWTWELDLRPSHEKW